MADAPRPPSAGTARLVSTLRLQASDLGAELAREVEEQLPIYRQWRELGHGEQLAAAIERVFQEFADLVETGEQHPDSQVFQMARTRARQGLPASAILGAWRVSGHGLWRWLTDRFPEEFAPGGDGIELWSRYLDFADRYVEQISDAFLEATQEERVREAMEGRARVDDLVRGMPPEETEQTLRELGVLARNVIVAMCRAPGARPDANAELVADYGNFLKSARLRTRMGVPWTMRSGALIAILPALEGHVDLVAQSIPPHSNMRVGASKIGPSRSDLSNLSRQAERALQACSANRPHIDLNHLTLLEIAAMQTPLLMDDVPEWVQTVLANTKNRDEWMLTAQTLFTHNGSVSATAKALNVHTNTVYYRLEAVEAATGRDLRDPQALADLELARASIEFGNLTDPDG